MRKIFNALSSCVSADLRFYARSWVPWLAGMAIIAYSSLIFFVCFREGSLLLSISANAYSTMTALLLFIMLGIHAARNDEILRCKEVFQCVPSGWLCKTAGKMLSGAAVAAGFCGLLFASYTLFLAVSRSHPLMYAHILAYIGLYFCIPSVTGLFLGIFLGGAIRGRGVYIAAIGAWAMLCPLNEMILKYVIQATLHIDSPSVRLLFNTINLGQHQSSYKPNIYMLNTGAVYWIGRLLILSGAAGLALSTARAIRSAWRISAALLAVILVFWALFAATDTPLRQFYFEYANQMLYGQRYETSYNTGNPLPPTVPASAMIPDKYTVQLETALMGVSVRCRIDLTAAGSTNGQPFSLYHGLSVTKVLVNGKPAEYARQGDVLNVVFPEAIPVGASADIYMEYSGHTSPLYHTAGRAVALYGQFPWLPHPGVLPLLDGDTPMRAIGFEEPVEYDLTWEPETSLAYSNLIRTGRRTWAGSSRNGLTLIANPMMAYDGAGTAPMYYPAQLANDLGLIRDIMRTYKDLERLLWPGRSEPYDPGKTVVISPSPVTPFNQFDCVESDGVYLVYVDTPDSLYYYKTVASGHILYGSVDIFIGRIVESAAFARADDIVRESFRSIATEYLRRVVDPGGDTGPMDGLIASLEENQFDDRNAARLAEPVTRLKSLLVPGGLETLHGIILRWYDQITGSEKEYTSQDMLDFMESEGLCGE